MSLAMQVAKTPSARRNARGDPGLFGTLGKIGGAALGVAGSVLPGPVGGIASAAGRALSGGRGSKSRPKPPGWATASAENYAKWARREGLPPVPGGIQTPTPGVSGFLQRTVPGGATGYDVQCIPKGYKLNETGYFLQDGTYVEPQSKIVKIRKRNPLNPRAASRAIRRLKSAKKAASSLNQISIRKKPCNR